MRTICAYMCRLDGGNAYASNRSNTNLTTPLCSCDPSYRDTFCILQVMLFDATAIPKISPRAIQLSKKNCSEKLTPVIRMPDFRNAISYFWSRRRRDGNSQIVDFTTGDSTHEQLTICRNCVLFAMVLVANDLERKFFSSILDRDRRVNNVNCTSRVTRVE